MMYSACLICLMTIHKMKIWQYYTKQCRKHDKQADDEVKRLNSKYLAHDSTEYYTQRHDSSDNKQTDRNYLSYQVIRDDLLINCYIMNIKYCYSRSSDYFSSHCKIYDFIKCKNKVGQTSSEK